ncbi:winged helix-turn-helix domain-containing protein [Streptomyces sp. NPDC060027]|uniref:winged helix-turn-helix domain-containing protein n=1 Tax=Streptomyces sp. NPDC060027 TaxID=3347040 RepID=UPI0036A56203
MSEQRIVGKGAGWVYSTLRSRIADGTYGLHTSLPSQRELTLELGVARDTVQRALKSLIQDGLIESRQGSGSRVIKRPDPGSAASEAPPGQARTLGWFFGRAFEQSEVVLDVFTLTSESIDAHIRLQVERIVNREISPQRIALRVLLPSEDVSLPYPRSKEDPRDHRLRDRLHEITRRHIASLCATFQDLGAEGLVPTLEEPRIRHVPLTPTFKVYLLNRSEMFQAPYRVIERRIALQSGEHVDALDVMGINARYTHTVGGHSDGPEAASVDSWQSWYDSLWDNLAE